MTTPGPTLTAAGYVLHPDAAYQSNYMTSGGRAAAAGAYFVAAKVVSITGGTSPQLQIRNGMSDASPIVRTVAAAPGATIDQRSAPDLCSQGLWISVSGNPVHFEIEVLWGSVGTTSGPIAPGSATIAAGTPSTTTLPLTITAPSTGGAPTSYATFYKRAIDSSYSAGPVGSSLTPTITGLTDTTSYNVKVVASNGSGAGPDSNVLTVSTQSAYVAALKALSPSGLWLLDEAAGATTFADSSGNGNTLTAAGTLLAGVMGLTPNVSSKNAVNFLGTGGDLTANPLQGRARAASNALFDYSTATSFSFMATVDLSDSHAQIPISKNGGGSDGYFVVIYGGTIALAISGVNYAVPLPTGSKLGPVHLAFAIDFTGSATNAVRIWIDGTLTQFDRTSTSSGLSHLADPWMIGGRSDGYSVTGRMQCAAFWSGAALSDAQVQALFTKHQQADRSAAIPFILSTDSGTGDNDDFTETAQAIYLHLIGRINLLGVIVAASDDYAAPAARAQLDHYGLTSIPVGSFQGSGIASQGTSAPAYAVRNHFRPTDVRANYIDAASLYATLLTAATPGSVVVAVGGTYHCEAQFLNASTANVTLWNQKVRALAGTAGQWPNSSSSASPAGNFATTGEYNIQAGPQQAADVVLKNTVPVYWHGVEISGNTGDDPMMAEFVKSTSPAYWDNSTNPIGYPSGISRTAWGQMGKLSIVEQIVHGSANPYWGTVQIATPVINTTTGQNASSAGSAQHYYFTPKLGALSLAQWRTMMSAQMDLLFPKNTNTYS